MKKEKFLFVVNPIAGGRDKTALIESIHSWAESSGNDVTIWKTTGEHDLKKLAEEISSVKPSKVIACGGDGTLQLCALLVKDTDMILGIIPGGSANGMATALNIPNNLKRALEIIDKNTIVNADLICFNHQNFSLHISDIGLNARLVKHFEEDGHRGFLGYASGVINEIIHLEEFEVEIHTEDLEIKDTSYMVAFANANRYGTGALLNNIGKLDDGFFEICILKKFDLTGIAGQFWDIIDEESDYMEVIQARRATVKTNRKVSFQIDGELQPDTDFIHIELIPNSLKIIVGKID